LGEMENLVLSLILEADCIESKTTIPRLYSSEKYYEPSNIDIYYKYVRSYIMEKFERMPFIEDKIQDITLECLLNSKRFDDFDSVKGWYYRAILRREKDESQSLRAKKTVRIENLPDGEVLVEICDKCSKLKEIYVNEVEILRIFPKWRYKRGFNFCQECWNKFAHKVQKGSA